MATKKVTTKGSAAEQRYNPHDTPAGAGLFPGLHKDTEWLKEQKTKKKTSARKKTK